MYQLRLVLEQVVDGLNNESLSQHDFVIHRHKFVLHVGTQAMYKMDTILEEEVKQGRRDVSSVCKYLSVQFLANTFQTLGLRSSMLAPVRQNVMISPLSLHSMWSLKP